MNDQTQHTPGPWEWPEIDDANDRLRAAASDMLAALLVIRQDDDDMVRYHNIGRLPHKARNALDAAIALAMGQ